MIKQFNIKKCLVKCTSVALMIVIPALTGRVLGSAIRPYVEQAQVVNKIKSSTDRVVVLDTSTKFIVPDLADNMFITRNGSTPRPVEGGEVITENGIYYVTAKDINKIINFTVIPELPEVAKTLDQVEEAIEVASLYAYGVYKFKYDTNLLTDSEVLNTLKTKGSWYTDVNSLLTPLSFMGAENGVAMVSSKNTVPVGVMKADTEKARDMLNDYLNTVDLTATPEEQCMATFEYLNENVEYDDESLTEDETVSDIYEHSILGIVEGKLVCQGYAYFLKATNNILGIPTYTKGDKTHVWNIVLINGQQYIIDMTNMCALAKNNEDYSVYYLITEEAYASLHEANEPTTYDPIP